MKTMRRDQAKLQMAGRTIVMATTFNKCWLPSHPDNCCQVSTPKIDGDGRETKHIDLRPTYEENEQLARELIRKRAEWHAREDLP